MGLRVREIQALIMGTKLYAALENKNIVDMKELNYIIPMALRHRVSSTQMLQILKYLDETNLKTDSKDISRYFFDQKITYDIKNQSHSPKNNINKNIDKKPTSPIGNSLLSKLNQLFNKTFKKNITSNSKKTKTINHDYNNFRTYPGNNNETNPNNLSINAPPNKARPIREIELSEVLTTEKELIKR